MNLEWGKLAVSTDIAGLRPSPITYTNQLYDAAGYANYRKEGVGFPNFVWSMLMSYLIGQPLDAQLTAIHARTGQLNDGYWHNNTALDILKLGLAEPCLPDLTLGSDMWMLDALAAHKVEDERKYWLVHNTEIDSDEVFARYVEIFKQEKYKSVTLAIENAPIPGGWEDTIKLVKRFRDAGIENIGIVGDSVHYLRGLGIALDDMPAIAKVWEQMIRDFRTAGIFRLHFSDGKFRDKDSHAVIAMYQYGLLHPLGAYIKAARVELEKECQHGMFGPRHLRAEIEYQKLLGGVELNAGLFHERHFLMKV